MKYKDFRIVTVRSINSTENAIEATYLKEITGNKDLLILPMDSPLEGKYGFSILTPPTLDGPEKQVIIQRKVHAKATLVRVSSKENFDQIFEDSYTRGLKIDLYDDPEKFLVGFMVFKNDTVTWYHTHISTLRG